MSEISKSFETDTKLPEGFYRDISTYDADLLYEMRIKIKYYNNSNEERTIYGNIVYHEIKSA